jgi:hypothetical protein
MGIVSRLFGVVFTILFVVGSLNFIGIWFAEANLLTSCEATPASCPHWLSSAITQGEYSAIGGAVLSGLIAVFVFYRFVYPGLKEDPADFAHVDRWLDSAGVAEALHDPAKARFAANLMERALDRQYADSERIASRAGALLGIFDGAIVVLAVAYLSHAVTLGTPGAENGFAWVAGANLAWGYAYLSGGDFEPINPVPLLEAVVSDFTETRAAYVREMVMVSARNEASSDKKLDSLLAGFIMVGIGMVILALSVFPNW